jgi:hypothetical protein
MAYSKRQEAEKLEFLYENDSGMDCAYCNECASEKDHIPPLVWVNNLGQEFFRNLGYSFLKVPCCSDCNSRLSKRDLFTHKERQVWLELRLIEVLVENSVEWTDEEIEELGPNLRSYVEARQRKRQALTRRIAFIRMCLGKD